MDLLEYSALRLSAAFFIPFALYMIVKTARRPDTMERYAWGITALSLVALTWLLNGYLNENSQLLVFMWPLFFGFCGLLGPAYYFALVGHRTRNLPLAILHLSPAIFIFTSSLISSFIQPLNQEDFTELFLSSNKIIDLPWSLLGNQILTVLLFPIHFLGYAAAALARTRDREQFFITLSLGIIVILFSVVYLLPANTERGILYVAVSLLELGLMFLFIRFLEIDSPRIQFERKQKLNVEPQNYPDIEMFLSDESTSHAVFARSKVNLERLASESDIEVMRWRNYLSDENQSFSDLKKRIRIRYAKQLIQEGYLKSYTIDSLAETIGYSSRTSFYSSYKEVTGNSWEGKATGEN